MTTVPISAPESPAAQVLSTSQVARQLGVSIGTIRRWSDIGQLESLRTASGSRRFTPEQLRACLHTLRQRPGRLTLGAAPPGLAASAPR